MEFDTFAKNFSLLKKIISPSDDAQTKVDLSYLENLILKTLPEALEKNAPSNFPELYFDFKYEYERFKEFILYDKLIGKNVVALGGGFSSGKSSFLNSLLGSSVLPANINPSTSVPAYIVNDEQVYVYGINAFNSRVDMEIEDVKAISHGFGKLNDDDTEITLGHILESIFISSPEQSFKNIALLDTPGYSKAESEDYSAKTDEKIARVQLNSSNYILWFVQADAGTITNEDIQFLSGLNRDIPKLIIVNKADKVLADDLKNIVAKIKDVLDMKGMPYVDVLTYSRRKGFDCDKDKIIAQLEAWNNEIYESRFAYNFKVLFTKCKEYYNAKLDDEGKRLNRLNKALTLSENDEVSECITSLVGEIKRSIASLKESMKDLSDLQNDFFAEIKRIGDIVNIKMPEPSEIDLIRDKLVDPKSVLDEYCEKNRIKRSDDLSALIGNIFADMKPIISNTEGDKGYSSELAAVIDENLKLDGALIKL